MAESEFNIKEELEIIARYVQGVTKERDDYFGRADAAEKKVRDQQSWLKTNEAAAELIGKERDAALARFREQLVRVTRLRQAYSALRESYIGVLDFARVAYLIVSGKVAQPSPAVVARITASDSVPTVEDVLAVSTPDEAVEREHTSACATYVETLRAGYDREIARRDTALRTAAQENTRLAAEVQSLASNLERALHERNVAIAKATTLRAEVEWRTQDQVEASKRAVGLYGEIAFLRTALAAAQGALRAAHDWWTKGDGANHPEDWPSEIIDAAINTSAKPAADAQIERMVKRFLTWKLPADFAPDGGISFKATFNEHTPWPDRHEPIGTNLLSATQAEAMVRHMIGGEQQTSAPSSEPLCTTCGRSREAQEAVSCSNAFHLAPPPWPTTPEGAANRAVGYCRHITVQHGHDWACAVCIAYWIRFITPVKREAHDHTYPGCCPDASVLDDAIEEVATQLAPAPPEGPEADRLERIAEVLTDCGHTDKQARTQAVAILAETDVAPTPEPK